MTTRRNVLALSGALGAMALFPAAALAEPGVKEFTRDLGRKVIRIAASSASEAEKKRQFLRLLTRYSNTRAIARFALGKYRRRMPKGLWDEYYRLVLDYIAGSFVYYREDLAAKDIRVKGAKKRGKWTTVETTLIFPGGKERPVVWRIYTGGGPYRVGDVKIRGIWLSLRMRDKFVSILNESKGDFNALMEYLRRNAA